MGHIKIVKHLLMTVSAMWHYLPSDIDSEDEDNRRKVAYILQLSSMLLLYFAAASELTNVEILMRLIYCSEISFISLMMLPDRIGSERMPCVDPYFTGVRAITICSSWFAFLTKVLGVHA